MLNLFTCASSATFIERSTTKAEKGTRERITARQSLCLSSCAHAFVSYIYMINQAFQQNTFRTALINRDKRHDRCARKRFCAAKQYIYCSVATVFFLYFHITRCRSGHTQSQCTFCMQPTRAVGRQLAVHARMHNWSSLVHLMSKMSTCQGWVRGGHDACCLWQVAGQAYNSC